MIIITLFFLFIICSWALVIHLDKSRIQDYLEARNCTSVDITWRLFGHGWLFEASKKEGGNRIYEVTYIDRLSNKKTVWCKTAMFSGVYFSEDNLQEDSYEITTEMTPEEKISYYENELQKAKLQLNTNSLNIPVSSNKTQTLVSTSNLQKPKKIGGWLILLAIAFILTPIRALITAIRAFRDLVLDPEISSFLSVIQNPSDENYNPLMVAWLYGGYIFSVVLMLLTIYLAYLFFSKKKKFVKWFLYVHILSLAFYVIYIWIGEAFFEIEGLWADTETKTIFFIILIPAIIWVPYLFISKRSKETFIKS